MYQLFSPKNNIPTNIINNSFNNNKYYHDYSKNRSRNINQTNNGISPVLTEYNIKNSKNNDSSIDLLKIKMSKSLSNIINSIKEQRKTSKFIKDLNKNKKFSSNYNKQIRFTFSSYNFDDFDEFYSPNKSKINIIQFNDKNKLNDNKNYYFIKKNISSDNFRRYYKRKNDRINFNAFNIRINNFVNAYDESKHFVMPVNKAVN